MSDPLAALRDAGRHRRLAGTQRTLRPRAVADRVLDLASNDYLALSRDARVVSAAVAATRRWGAGSTGSRLVTGSTTLHAELEARLAGFVGAAAGLVFSSGYLANLGAVAALAGPDCLLVSDALNHASIVDACRLSRSPVAVTGHGDVDAVDAALVARSQPRALVVTDAVFSVDGDLAPLVELHRTCRRHGALLLVDEAHGIGVLGDGRGAAAAAGIASAPDVVLTVTLSKALAAQGGAVLGADLVVEHCVNTARSFLFDTGLAPGSVGAALEALRIVEREPSRPATVRRRARDLASAAREAGWPVAAPPTGAVASLLAGAPAAASAAAAVCLEDGVRVGCFRPPSVPDGVSRLRLAARADLTDDDVARAAAALRRAREHLP